MAGPQVYNTYMEQTQQILTLILSSLAILLLLIGIVSAILIVKVILVVKRVTNKAEHLAEQAEAFSEFVQHAATPLLIGRLFSNLSDTFFKNKSNKRK